MILLEQMVTTAGEIGKELLRESEAATRQRMVMLMVCHDLAGLGARGRSIRRMWKYGPASAHEVLRCSIRETTLR